MAAFAFFKINGGLRQEENPLANPALSEVADSVILAPQNKNVTFKTPSHGTYHDGAGTLTVKGIENIQRLLFIPFVSATHPVATYLTGGVNLDTYYSCRYVCNQVRAPYTDDEGEEVTSTAYCVLSIKDVSNKKGDYIHPAFLLGIESIIAAGQRHKGHAARDVDIREMLNPGGQELSIRSEDCDDGWGDESSVLKAPAKSTLMISQRPEQSAVFQFRDSKAPGVTPGMRPVLTSPYVRWEQVKKVKNKTLAKPELRLQVYRGA